MEPHGGYFRVFWSYFRLFWGCFGPLGAHQTILFYSLPLRHPTKRGVPPPLVAKRALNPKENSPKMPPGPPPSPLP